MSRKYTHLLWLLSLFFLLSLAFGSQTVSAAPEAINPSPFTFPATVTADDTNSVTVNLTGVTTVTTNVTLSLVDSTSTTTTPVPAANGATVNSFESNTITALTPTGTSQVTFHQVKITTPSGATQYKLRLATTAGTIALSNAFTVTHGVLQRVTITTGPTPTTTSADSLFSLSGNASDAAGNPVSGAAVTAALFVAGSATLADTDATPVTTNASGVFTFTKLNINKTGTYTLTVTAATTTPSASVTSAPSAPITITPGAPQLTFTTQPGNAQSNAPILTAVHLQDSSHNPLSGASVSLALSGGPGALAGTTTVNTDSNGDAAFNNLSVNKVGTTYKLTASAPGITPTAPTPVASNAFAITAGTASAISFAQQPSTTPAGSAIAPPVSVLVTDSGGNPVSGASVTVSLLGGATLSGTQTVSTGDGTGGTTLGVASFSGLKVSAPGTYQLTANTGSLSVTSSIFNVTAGAPTTLVFGQPPTGTASGAIINPPVTVLLKDGSGNLTTSTAAVTLSIAAGSPPGAVLGGTVTVNAVNGVATFADLTLDKTGAYTLTAFAPGAIPAVTPVTSGSFTITAGRPNTIVFTSQPTDTVAGAVINSPSGVAAVVKDVNGNPVAGVSVTLTPTTGTLNGTATIVTDANGKAAFTDLSIDKSSTIKLLASVAGVAPLASNSFTVAAGPATTLTFTTQPAATTVAGTAINSPGAVTVTATDAQGNPVSGVSVTLALSGGPGALAGTTTVSTDSNGKATFSNLSVNKTGSSYLLTASAPGVLPTAPTPVTSSSFAIAAGTPSTLTFSTQPAVSAVADSILRSPGGVVVTATDAKGNPVSSVTITVALIGGAFTPSSTTTISTDGNGKAAFSNLSVDTVGTGYKITASAPGVLPTAPTPVTSSAFAITQGAPATISFVQQPSTTPAGTAIAPPISVLVTDSGGNPVSGASVTVTLSGGTGTLKGTQTLPTGDGTGGTTLGVASFSTLSVNKVGTSYVLTAATPGADPANSNLFAITPGAPVLTFATQPTADPAKPASIPSGVNIPVKVHLQDGSGNVLAGQSVTLTLSSNSFTSTSTITISTDSNGDAAFSNLSINPAATAYTITAKAPGITPIAPSAIESYPFAVTSGAVSSVVFSIQPSNISATPLHSSSPSVIAPAVVVTVTDAAGNPVPNQNVQLALAAGSTGTLSGTIPQPTDASGNATFTDLSIDTPGPKQLSATVTAGNVRTQTNSSSFLVGNLPSAITSLSNIGSIHAGDPDFTLIINGSNFVVPTTSAAGSTVMFTDRNPVTGNIETTPLTLTGTPTSTIITALVPAALIAEAQTATVTVTNPAGITSGSLTPATSSFPILPLGPSADVNVKSHPNGPDGQPQQFFDAGLQLFSVPFDYTLDDNGKLLLTGGVLGAFQISLNAANGTVANENILPRLAVWDPIPASYLLTSTAVAPVFTDGLSADSLVLGQGYWARFQYQPTTDPTRQSGLLTRGPEAAELTDTRKLDGQHRFAIALHPGWNMIGDPFTGSVNLRDVQVLALNADGTTTPISLVDANTQGYVSATFYKYAGAAGYVPVAANQGDNSLRPYIGYWVHAYQACTLLVPQP